MPDSPIFDSHAWQRLVEFANQKKMSLDAALSYLLDSESSLTRIYRDSLLDQISDAVIITDQNLKIVSWNQAAVRIYGWTLAEALGRNVDDLLSTEWVFTPQQEALAVLANTGQWYGQLLQTTRSGEKRIIAASVSFLKDVQDTIVGGITVNRDVTGWKEIEEQLRNSEASLRLLFENNPHPMWVYDLETMAFIEVNLAAITNYGYSREEFLSMTLKDIRPADDIPALLESVYSSRPALQFSNEWRHKRKNGEIFPVEITSHQLNYKNRDAVLVVAMDITKRKQAERLNAERNQLNALLEKERELNLWVQSLISTVSHDIKNSLTVIASSQGLLNNYFDKLNAEERQAKRHQIDHQLKVMVELLNSLNEEIQSGFIRRTFRPSEVNLALLCQLTVNDIQNSMGKRHQVHFVTLSNPPPPAQTAYVDEILVTRILINLLSNAVKFSPEGGEIRLELSQDEHLAVIRVVDHGMGIPENEIDKIFTPFYRIEQARNIQGSGLGLSIVLDCVERHNGTITLESTPGKGTVFTVKLPTTYP